MLFPVFLHFKTSLHESVTILCFLSPGSRHDSLRSLYVRALMQKAWLLWFSNQIFCLPNTTYQISTFVILSNYTIIFNTLSEVFEISKILFTNTPSILIFATH